MALLLLPIPRAGLAETVQVNVADLSVALDASRTEPDAVRRLLLAEIQQKLDQLDLQLADGNLLLRDEIVDRTVEDGCTSTEIRQLTTEVTLSGDTGITIDLESLFDPLELTLRLVADVDAIGRAQQVFGFRLGSCRELASDSFDFSAAGPVDVQLDLSLALNPEWMDGGTLRINPLITITGELRQADIVVDVDDSLLRGVLESFIQDEVDDLFSVDRLQQELADLQQSLNDQLLSDSSNGAIDIELPPSDDEQILALFELLSPTARFPLTADFLRDNRLEIIAALVFEDDDRLTEIIEDAAFCQLTSALQVDLPVSDVFQWRDGQCVSADLSQTGTRFSDAACANSFEFFPTDFNAFCATALDANRLGNAESNSAELLRWSQSPGSRFEIGALPVAGKVQPFVQRVNYKNVPTSAGNCSLELRVYTDQPNSTNKKTMIAFHGGGWQNRGTGFLGVENMATHFVGQGFVVFAPFYRLVHDSDGSAACHNASFEDLLNDADDALTWVQQNADQYGAGGKPVLFGQSAGGHMAAYLSVNKPDQVERAVLFYAPTDFKDFANQIQRGEYTNNTGITIMRRVTGIEVENLDLFSPLVSDNTLPAKVEQQPQNYPPMFIMHGESDSLLPSRQSVRMCNGLTGSIDNGPVPYEIDSMDVIRSYACDDRGSQLHLIAGAEHTLDLCLSDELCISGSPASAAATAQAIDQMLDWTAKDTLSVYAASDSGSNSAGRSGTGATGLRLLVLLTIISLISRRLRSSRRH